MTTPPEATPTPPPAGPPLKQGMSTGVKVAIGCGILVLVVLIGIVVALVAGGLFIRDKAGDFRGGLEAQAEATQTVRRLESEHPFTAPADGVVDEERAERFLDVTDAAWDDVKDQVDDLVEREQEIRERRGNAGIGDVTAGFRGMGDARVALAEALEEHEMSVSEYLWTGIVLQRAYGAVDAPGGPGDVPPANLDVAAERRDRLEEVFGDDAESRKGFVYIMAWTMGAGEAGVRGGLGLDTLRMPSGN